MKFVLTAFVDGFRDQATGIRSSIFSVAVGSLGLLAIGCKRHEGMADPLSGTKPGEMRFFSVHDDVDLEFRWVPAGDFVMGSPPDEVGRSEGEEQKNVRIRQGFWIAENETTFGIWQKVMKLRTPIANPLLGKPVTHVSWFDCQDFLKRLKAPAAGWKYELPTEMEWEYACRAGSKSAYTGQASDSGWLRVNSGGCSHPVGTKTPNRWSINDMHGNIAEWCRDREGATPGNAFIRGGSWASDFASRAGARNFETPYLRSNRVGFRLVLARDDSEAVSSISTKRPPQLP